MRYKEYAGVRFYRNQPEYSLLNHAVYAVKAGVYNYPMLRELLRKLRDWNRSKQYGTAPDLGRRRLLLEFAPSRPGA
jgi:hypothetical protein